MKSAIALLVGALLALPLPCSAQDHQREARWRAEVVPNLVVGEAVDIRASSGRDFLGLYVRTPGAETALVIVHGIGVHPDHGVIGRLRLDLADKGFSTLSIQMPVLGADAQPDRYRDTFADAGDRLTQAAKWLQAKGYRDMVLVSHSLGSRMANDFFDRSGASAFRAWVCLGLNGGFSESFVEKKPLPVLDAYGERDNPGVLAGVDSRARLVAALRGSSQVRVAGADHFYAGRERDLVETIGTFVRR